MRVGFKSSRYGVMYFVLVYTLGFGEPVNQKAVAINNFTLFLLCEIEKKITEKPPAINGGVILNFNNSL